MAGARNIGNTLRLGSRRAASLVELLTVAGIIAVLVGIIVPAVWVGVGYARKAICAGRLHALYAAMMAYAADYDHRLPLVHFVDPTKDPNFDVRPQDIWPPYPQEKSPPLWYTLHYAMGDYADSSETFFCPSYPALDWMKQWPWDVLPAPPAEKWWMSYIENVGMAALDLRELTWPPQYAGLLRCDGHFGRYNILFADGHVRATDDFTKFACIRERWSFMKKAIAQAYPELK